MRGERLDIERPEGEFERALERGVSDHGVGAAGLEQVFHHVEDEQGAHAVVGEALPHLRREQEGKPARMAEQLALRAGRGARCGGGASYPHIGIPVLW